ncbi:DUF6766 family protein [Paenarthrobacter sp. NPDC092416]
MQNRRAMRHSGAVLVGASVYLREPGSPESKPVAEPHYETGA